MIELARQALYLKLHRMMKTRFSQIASRVSLVLLCASVMTACAKPGASGSKAKLIPAPIHGVNYTAEPFKFVLVDPLDAENAGGGETVNPYGAGGSMCCYALPAKWRPGLTVEVNETYWLPQKTEAISPHVKKKHVVEVPKYPSGEAGALWVLREPGGKISVVSSGVQPDHPNWTGNTKGWPVPSLDDRRALHDRAIAEAQANVDLFVGLLEELTNDPIKHASVAWAHDKLYQPATLARYKGFSDPAYLAMLKGNYETELLSSRNEVAQKKAARP